MICTVEIIFVTIIIIIIEIIEYSLVSFYQILIFFPAK